MVENISACSCDTGVCLQNTVVATWEREVSLGLLAYAAQMLQFKSLENQRGRTAPQVRRWKGAQEFSVLRLNQLDLKHGVGRGTLLVPPFTSYRPGSAEPFLQWDPA